MLESWPRTLAVVRQLLQLKCFTGKMAWKSSSRRAPTYLPLAVPPGNTMPPLADGLCAMAVICKAISENSASFSTVGKASRNQ